MPQQVANSEVRAARLHRPYGYCLHNKYLCNCTGNNVITLIDIIYCLFAFTHSRFIVLCSNFTFKAVLIFCIIYYLSALFYIHAQKYVGFYFVVVLVLEIDLFRYFFFYCFYSPATQCFKHSMFLENVMLNCGYSVFNVIALILTT